MDESDRASKRIVIVGPCASGKSTLVERLRREGYDAYAVAQEHSSVRNLWQRQSPDLLIGLVVSLDAVRARRSPEWLEAVYRRQLQRLAEAYAAADLLVDTTSNDADGVFRRVEAFLQDFR